MQLNAFEATYAYIIYSVLFNTYKKHEKLELVQVQRTGIQVLIWLTGALIRIAEVPIYC
jgi:hypothetical protein